MKRIILLLCTFLPILASAQSKFSVYRSVEDVVRYEDNLRYPVQKGDLLSERDLIEVPVKQGIHILEKETNRIYTNVKAGKQTVGAIIDKSEKDANSTFTNLNRQISKNIAKNSQGKGYSTYGMTTRGLSDELTFVDSLYYSIYTCVNNILDNDVISMKKIVNEDETISFMIDNTGSKVIYVSILYGNPSHLTICLDGVLSESGAVPIPPHSTLDLSSYRYIEPDTHAGYYLVSSDNMFDLSYIKSRLLYMRAPDFILDENIATLSIVK
jgi:hypothetical protein